MLAFFSNGRGVNDVRIQRRNVPARFHVCLTCPTPCLNLSRRHVSSPSVPITGIWQRTHDASDDDAELGFAMPSRVVGCQRPQRHPQQQMTLTDRTLVGSASMVCCC